MKKNSEERILRKFQNTDDTDLADLRRFFFLHSGYLSKLNNNPMSILETLNQVDYNPEECSNNPI